MSRRASPKAFQKAIDVVLLDRLEQLLEEIDSEFDKHPRRYAFGCAPAYLRYELDEALMRVKDRWRATRKERNI